MKRGTRKVEVKKDGFTVYGEEVEIEDGKRRILTARLVHQAIAPQAEEAKQPTNDETGKAVASNGSTGRGDAALCRGNRGAGDRSRARSGGIRRWAANQRQLFPVIMNPSRSR